MSLRRWRLSPGRWLWPYGTLAVVLGAVMLPAWLTADVLVGGGDALLAHYPYFVLWRDALARGELPFWNPYTFSGFPAFATLQAGYGYPPHWALSWSPAILAMNWTIGLHVLLAGLGAAWCAGRLGATREGQFLGGVAYALGSVLTARIWAGHLSFVEANAWLPLATGLAVRLNRPPALVLLALVVALMTLAGQPEILIFCLWWLPLWAGVGAWGSGLWSVTRAVMLTGLGLGLGLGLAAFQLLPVIAMLSVSNRQVGMSWDFVTGASLPPWHLLALLHPLVFGHPHQGYWPGPGYEWHERLLYIGVVPLLAAAWAPGRWRWICWGCAGLAIALAFGRYVPWYALIHAFVPGYGTFRIPSKHLTLAGLALALASGLGVQHLQGRKAAALALGLAVLVAASSLTFPTWFPPLAAALGGAERLAGPTAIQQVSAAAVPALQAASVVMLLAALAMLAPAPWAPRLQVLLATLELVLLLQPFRLAQADPRSIVVGADLLRGYERVAVIGGGGALLANFGPVLQVEQPAGYMPLFSSGYAALLTGSPNPGVAFDLGWSSEPVLRLLGYGVFVDREQAQVRIVQPPPPEAWVARCAWPGGALEVRQPEFPRQSCVARSSATTREQPTPPGTARVLARGSGSLVIEAEGPGWLVTTEPWYPGWAARIAGAPAPVEVLDGALVGVRLEPGTQTVALQYTPAGLERGLAISVGTGLVLLALWWMCRKPGDPSQQAQHVAPDGSAGVHENGRR